MDRHIKLKEPYWSAGTRYGWAKELGDSVGFGVNQMLLIGDGNLTIETDQAFYTVDKELAKEAVRHYHAYCQAKNVRLMVIPRCLCQYIKK